MTILLVGCGKSKLDTRQHVPAQDLYVGPLFRARRRHAEASGQRWLILSAKHRVIKPEKRIQTYDLHLGWLSQEERLAWAERVWWRLGERMGLSLARVEVHAGAVYVKALQKTAPRSTRISWPVQGLQVGEQLAWYKGRHRQPTQLDIFGQEATP